jgi:hypothetical protein
MRNDLVKKKLLRPPKKLFLLGTLTVPIIVISQKNNLYKHSFCEKPDLFGYDSPDFLLRVSYNYNYLYATFTVR